MYILLVTPNSINENLASVNTKSKQELTQTQAQVCDNCLTAVYDDSIISRSAQYEFKAYIGEANTPFTISLDLQQTLVNQWALYHHINGYTVYLAKGYWQGVPENTIVFELIAEKDKLPNTKQLEHLKQITHQQAILVTVKELIHGFLVGS